MKITIEPSFPDENKREKPCHRNPTITMDTNIVDDNLQDALDLIGHALNAYGFVVSGIREDCDE